MPGISPVEFFVLDSVRHYGHYGDDKESLIHNAYIASPHVAERAYTVAEIRSAYEQCERSNWIQVADATTIRDIREYVDRNDLARPIFGFPEVGGVVFTHDGAAMYLKALKQRSIDTPVAKPIPPGHEFENEVRAIDGYYLFSLDAAFHERRWLEDCGRNVTACRVEHDVLVYWWKVHSTVYYIESDTLNEAGEQTDVTELDSFADESQRTSADASASRRSERMQDPAAMHTEREMLIESLGTYGVADAEWLLFTAIASRDVYESRAIESAMEVLHSMLPYLGAITEEQCRQAVDECLAKGWICVVTRDVWDKRERSIAEKGLGQPLHKVRSLRQLDVTPEGARVFDAVATSVFGKDWSFHDYVHVTKYRTVRYFYDYWKRAKFGAWFTRHRSGIVSVVGPKRIGPWAPYWWWQFPEGFIVDAEFSDRRD